MVIRFLAVLTLFSNIALLIVFSFWLAKIYSRRAERIWADIYRHIANCWKWGVLLVSSVATIGSLYMSDVAGLTPCKLCWYQRIFMYPIPLIIIWSFLKRSSEAARVTIPLAAVGAAIALFHYSLQFAESPSTTCLSVGFSVSCSERFATHFGYITIPFMAFSAFATILVLVAFQRKNG